jgi:hypothetical protein
MSEIRVNNVIADNGLDAVNFSKGINVSSGIITATSFSGSGASLTGTGKILQVVSVTKTDVSTIATSGGAFFNYDNASLKVTLTPSSASNKILLIGDVCVSSNTNVGAMFVRFHKDGSVLTGSVGDASGSRGRMTSAAIQHSNNYPTFHSLSFLDTAGNTNSRYYNFGIAQNSGSGRNVKFNDSYTTSDSFGYGLYSSTITAMEIEA